MHNWLFHVYVFARNRVRSAPCLGLIRSKGLYNTTYLSKNFANLQPMVLPFLIYRQKSNIVRCPLVDLQYLVYHLSPVCSIRAFAKELDLSFWKLWDENLWSLPNWNQYWENRKKNTKVALLGWYQKWNSLFSQGVLKTPSFQTWTRWYCLMILYPVERCVIAERSAIWFYLKKH